METMNSTLTIILIGFLIGIFLVITIIRSIAGGSLLARHPYAPAGYGYGNGPYYHSGNGLGALILLLFTGLLLFLMFGTAKEEIGENESLPQKDEGWIDPAYDESAAPSLVRTAAAIPPGRESLKVSYPTQDQISNFEYFEEPIQKSHPEYFLQTGSFQNAAAATSHLDNLQKTHNRRIFLGYGDGKAPITYKALIGPFSSPSEADRLSRRLKMPDAFVRTNLDFETVEEL